MEAMKSGERMLAVLRGEEADRMPILELLMWWDKTVQRWQNEGLPRSYSYDGNWKDIIDLQEYWGLDIVLQWWVRPYTASSPLPVSHGSGRGAETEEGYIKKLRPTLYPDVKMDEDFLRKAKELKSSGRGAVQLIINGAFWEPREYMGIENHLLSFYDQGDLYDMMVDDIVAWEKRVIEYAANTFPFDYVAIAEDMSYNHGSMISRELFDRFIAPYYKKITPLLKAANMFVIVDSDGDIAIPIEWFNNVGVEGYLPLERQSGLDINTLQSLYPKTGFIGHFDKTVMCKGEKELRQEFERLLPAMRRGRFIVNCDHQTPPETSFGDYAHYVRLLREYASLL
ncbi:MAG: hypothetical protein FWF26_04690 [Treponema sp.]|nr:hypothetical protein [Treponema sp.]